MRTLKIEELALVAGAGTEPGSTKDEEKNKGNNGLGNGDQTAPGNSLTHNAAENNVSNMTGTGNPPGSGNFPVIPN